LTFSLGTVKKWKNGTGGRGIHHADSDGRYWHQRPACSDAATLTNNGDEALEQAMVMAMTMMTMTMAMMATTVMMTMIMEPWEWQQQ